MHKATIWSALLSLAATVVTGAAQMIWPQSAGSLPVLKIIFFSALAVLVISGIMLLLSIWKDSSGTEKLEPRALVKDSFNPTHNQTVSVNVTVPTAAATAVSGGNSPRMLLSFFATPDMSLSGLTVTNVGQSEAYKVSLNGNRVGEFYLQFSIPQTTLQPGQTCAVDVLPRYGDMGALGGYHSGRVQNFLDHIEEAGHDAETIITAECEGHDGLEHTRYFRLWREDITINQDNVIRCDPYHPPAGSLPSQVLQGSIALPSDCPKISFLSWGQNMERVPSEGDRAVIFQKGFNLSNDGGAALEVKVHDFMVGDKLATSSTIARIGPGANGFARISVEASNPLFREALPQYLTQAVEQKINNGKLNYGHEYRLTLCVTYRDFSNNWYESVGDLIFHHRHSRIEFGPVVQRRLESKPVL